MSIVKIIASITIPVVLTGCALGVGYYHPKTVSYSEPEAELSKSNIGYVSKRSNTGTAPIVYTKSSVLETWGKPQKIDAIETESEKWTYSDKEIIWQGPVLGIGLPIPLTIIPSGKRKTVLTFEGNNLVKIETRHTIFSYVGYLVGDNGGGWRAFSQDENE